VNAVRQTETHFQFVKTPDTSFSQDGPKQKAADSTFALAKVDKYKESDHDGSTFDALFDLLGIDKQAEDSTDDGKMDSEAVDELVA